MNEVDGYVLRGGEAGAQRLALLARVMWPTTKAFLRQAGLRRGMRCLDVGCGSGAVTLALARIVGKEGSAVGIDLDERALDMARQQAVRRRSVAVFHPGNAAALDEPPVHDLVFARFVLTHLPDPAQGLAGMVRATVPGGTVAIEDIDFTGSFSYPYCFAFHRYLELYQEVVRRKGSDATIGPRLLGLAAAAGLADLRLQVLMPAFHDGEGKRMAAVTMEHIREAVVDAGLATNAEVDAIVAELEDFAAQPLTILSLPRIFQVWGIRK